MASEPAWRFFWCWLIVASAFSLSANVAHAVLLAPGDVVWLTGVAAVVPPCVLIAAVHSISLLVRTRANGPTYWTALAMTMVVGAFAFILSFDAIRSLATTLGFTGQLLGVPIAAIFPLAIDVSIAHATLCLLSLAPPSLARSIAPVAASSPVATRAPTAAEAPPPPDAGRGDRSADHEVEDASDCVVAMSPRTRPLAAVSTAAADAQQHHAGHAGPRGRSDTSLRSLAETLVRNKVTTKAPELVAVLLADRAAGMRPTAIATKHQVHHSVVRKVLHAAALEPG
jgi:hypothetical protein